MTTVRFKPGVMMITAVGLGVPVLGSLLCGLVLPAGAWINPMAHTVMEAAGSVMAVWLGWALLSRRMAVEEVPYRLWCACGLIGMGVLDGFHAVGDPGETFVWLRSVASLVGGALFALVWLPDRWAASKPARWLPWIVLTGAVALGAGSSLFPDGVPPMLHAGVFSPASKLLNIAAGLWFFAAAGRFLMRYRRHGGSDEGLFAMHCLLFGAAGLLFQFSALWDPSWWWWHGVRLVAYGALLRYLPRLRVQANVVMGPYAWLPVLLVLMVVATLLIGAVALHYVENRLVAMTGESLALAAADIADKLDRLLFERYGDSQMIARAFASQTRNGPYMTEYLAWMKKAYPVYLWLGVTDRAGRVIAASDPSSMGLDLSRDQWFQRARDEGGVQIGDVGAYEAVQGMEAVAFTIPIHDPQGAFLGTVTTRVGLPALEEVVTNTIRAVQAKQEFLGTVEYQFLTRAGDVFVDSDLAHKGFVNLKQLGLPSASRLGADQPGDTGYTEEMHLRRRVPVVTGYARTRGHDAFAGLQWGVLVRVDRRDILAPIRAVLWKLGAAGALVVVPLVGFLLWSSDRLRREWAQAEAESARARAAEGALRESEARIRVIVETALDAVVVMDADGRITEWNAQAETMFGWSRVEAIGRMLADTIVPPAYREAHTHGLRRFLASGHGPLLNRRIEIVACRRDGRTFPVELTVTPARQGDRYTFSAFVRDMTRQKEAAKRQAAQMAVSLILAEARTLDAAAPKLLLAVCDTVGWELGELWRVDRTANLLRCETTWHVPSSEIEAFASLSRGVTFSKGIGLPGRVWAKGEPAWIPDVLEDGNFPRAAGAAKAGLHSAIGFPILLDETVVGVLEFFSREVRSPDDDLLCMMAEIGIKIGQFIERGFLEEQLRQSQKMDAIGRLAGGIAHDFNNLLTVINGYSQILLSQPGLADEPRGKVEEIKKAGERAAALTRQLLAFSRRQVLTSKVVDLNALVAGMNGMLRRLIGEDIDLVAAPGSDLGAVKADPGQIEQVILNLAVNARDAMPTGGRLTIETGNVDVAEPLALGAGSVPPGSYVTLVVRDTGCGMDAHTQANMFEPFFTTKERGKGTGLGLATVYGIVKQSGGHILVASEVGKGATVTIFLPRAPQVMETVAPASAAARPAPGAETLLLVEDEESIRKLFGHELRARGYEVLEAADGGAAIELCRRHQGAIHLLVTDVVMPGVNGRELAERLLPLRPDMRVLYMSGYADDAVVRRGVLQEETDFLQKPFTLDVLVRKVRDVLDLPGSQADRDSDA